MICDEDPLRRRPRQSTARRKRQERCVWITTKLAEWASEHGRITKIGLSDGCGGETIPVAVGFGYYRSGFESYLGNVDSYLGSRPSKGTAIHRPLPRSRQAGGNYAGRRISRQDGPRHWNRNGPTHDRAGALCDQPPTDRPAMSDYISSLKGLLDPMTPETFRAESRSRCTSAAAPRNLPRPSIGTTSTACSPWMFGPNRHFSSIWTPAASRRPPTV